MLQEKATVVFRVVVESASVIVTGNSPGVFGVPVMTAWLLTVDRVSPGGSVAAGSDQVYPGTPPDAAGSVRAVIAVPTKLAWGAGAVAVSAGTTVQVKDTFCLTWLVVSVTTRR